jgi:hypothetical protein
MSSWKFPIKSFMFISSIIVITLLAYDTKSSGSFKKSYTGNLLKDTGALPVVEQAYNKIELYSTKVYSWLSVNVPIYWKSISAVIGPYLSVFWEKFAEVMLYLWDSTEVIRLWFNKNIPPILETITDSYVPKIQSIVWRISSQLQSHLSTVWAFILKTALLASNWLQTNVLTGSLAPENIQKVTIEAIESSQKYAAEVYNWFASHIKALVY